jgi:hypothetical protein
MSGPDEARSRPSLEVPLSTVPTRGSRRALVAALGICAVLGGSIGLAALAGQPGTSRPSPSAAALVPSASSPTRPATETPVDERLPEVRSVILDGAPGLGFLHRDGDELQILAWYPDGDGLRTIASVPGVYKGTAPEDVAVGSISHDGRYALIQIAERAETETLRLISNEGVVWERHDVTSNSWPLWARAANRVVIPLDEKTWLVVDLEAGKPAVHSIDVRGLRPPGPPPDLDFVARPLAFSADERWIYGEASANVDPRNRTLFRAGAAGDRATRIRQLPTTGPGRALSDVHDPASGRTVDPTDFPNGSISSLVVRNPDGTRAWEARFPAVLGTAWLGDGRLVVMHSDRFDGPRYVSLIAMSRSGAITESLLEAGPLEGGGLLGVREGYVVAGYFAASPSMELLVVMLDPRNGGSATLHLSADKLTGLQLGGWLE